MSAAILVLLEDTVNAPQLVCDECSECLPLLGFTAPNIVLDDRLVTTVTTSHAPDTARCYYCGRSNPRLIVRYWRVPAHPSMRTAVTLLETVLDAEPVLPGMG